MPKKIRSNPNPSFHDVYDGRLFEKQRLEEQVVGIFEANMYSTPLEA
jgi:hypothetical protein